MLRLPFEDFVIHYTFQAMDIAMENLAINQTVRGTMTFDFSDFKAKTGQNPDIPKMVFSLTKKGKDIESKMQSRFVNLGIEVFEKSFIKGYLL